MPSAAARHVFVYGTLRQGEERDITRLLPAPRWIGQARVQGALYHLGAYPGVVLGEPGSIHGEVYEISPELERQLDEIEEVWPQQSGEYAKREIMVQLDEAHGPAPGEPVPSTGQAPELLCIVYEIAPERIGGMPVIVCGNWAQRHVPEPTPP